ncbi:MAG: MMPL family transporter [Planctomycetota bacterium]|nr:MAG: MMPL family transporter [Planctomycetota bacterium]
MLFKSLGDLAAHKAVVILLGWISLLVVCIWAAPDLSEVAQNGEFAFLPEAAASRVAEAKFKAAFPNDLNQSNIVLVVRREQDEGLQPEDYDFLSQSVIPELHRIAGLPTAEESDADTDDEIASAATTTARIAQAIDSFEDKRVGDLYISDNKQATSIVVSLRTEFLDQSNTDLVDKIEALVNKLKHTPTNTDEPSLPAGMEIALSGTATFGRDMIQESRKSAKSTEKWTVILVVGLLIIIYRAPALAMIPLITVAVSTIISMKLLILMAQAGWITLFNGIETYVTVLVYGAGVDYCLFLVARYREELDGGLTIEDAVSGTLERVGAALTASAGTVVCGIGMMIFAEFGKFREAGIAISFGLTVCLCAALTLTPAILRLAGRFAFWPSASRATSRNDTGFLSSTDLTSRIKRANLLTQGWQWIGEVIERRAWMAWSLSIVLMLPFVVAGVLFFGNLSYGLLSELPDTASSVYGAQAAQRHFPAGEVAPLRVLMQVKGMDFSPIQGESEQLVEQFTDNLIRQKDSLGLYAVRSLAAPKGQRKMPVLSFREMPAYKMFVRKKFVSSADSSIMCVELIFKNDPFSRTSIADYRNLRDRLQDHLPEGLKDANLYFVGSIPQISDLKDVTDSDQFRIDALVLGGVYVILVLLLKKPGVCAYLMFTVFYSYLATLGFTYLVFWLTAANPSEFAGLDWKVPMFLFTILIAVGEDYNIFLMARIEEEQKIHGPVKGIIVALERTGSIISSCGIIMAGTFCSLMAGSLVGMDQLGLALAAGVLLDTFVIRPVMVPSMLILLSTGRLGILSRWGGFEKKRIVNVVPKNAAKSPAA